MQTSADIEGNWGIRNDRLRINYGLLKLNNTVAELKIINSTEIGGKLKLYCEDQKTYEKVIAWVYPDPGNEERPILDLDLASQKQFLRFYNQKEDGVKRKTYFYKNLSRVYDYKIDLRYKKRSDGYYEKSLTVTLYDKSGNFKTRIENVEFDSWKDIDHFRVGSKISGVDNHGDEIGDSEDFIVADFNFDGREDFAIKNNVGGNRGALFSFYIQNQNGTYKLDQYLTDKVLFLPDLDKESKSLITWTYQQLGLYTYLNYFRQNKSLGTWEFYKYKETDISEAGVKKITYYEWNASKDDWVKIRAEIEYTNK